MVKTNTMSAGSLMFVKAWSASFWLVVAMVFVMEVTCGSVDCEEKVCHCDQIAAVNGATKVLKDYYAERYNEADQRKVVLQMRNLSKEGRRLSSKSPCVTFLVKCFNFKGHLSHCMLEPFKASFSAFWFGGLAGYLWHPVNCKKSKNWPRLIPKNCP